MWSVQSATLGATCARDVDRQRDTQQCRVMMSVSVVAITYGV
jgi:hypothetical protein